MCPPATYLDHAFLALLNDTFEQGKLEYNQVNLGNVQTHPKVFRAPYDKWRGVKLSVEKKDDDDEATDERGFDVVYDLTGETAYDKPELIRINLLFFFLTHTHSRPKLRTTNYKLRISISTGQVQNLQHLPNRPLPSYICIPSFLHPSGLKPMSVSLSPFTR